MKRIILFVAHILSITSCQESQINIPEKIAIQPRGVIEKPYANPAIIQGCSFGAFFQSLYRNNQYQAMCLFTSKLQREFIGDDSLIKYFKNEFNLDYNLGRLTNVQYQNDTILLTYANASKYATRTKVIIYCAIENDTTKFIGLTN